MFPIALGFAATSSINCRTDRSELPISSGLAEAEFGFSPAEIHAAGEHFAVIGEDRDGELYWVRPANLFAIWWGLQRDHPPGESARQASGASPA